jgi:hypothetical protein
MVAPCCILVDVWVSILFDLRIFIHWNAIGRMVSSKQIAHQQWHRPNSGKNSQRYQKLFMKTSYSLSNGQQCAKSLLSPVSHISGTHSYSLSNGHQCKKTNCLVLHSPIDDNHSYYFINGHKCTSSSLSPALPLSWQSLILVHQCTKSLLNPAFPLLTTTHTIWAMATNVTSFCQVLHSHMNGNHVTNTKGGGINKLV